MFSDIEPFNSGLLKVDSVHSIFWETSGNPRGIPALFLHGGPGAGNRTGYRKLFDPQNFLIISFDQRGCGRSKPTVNENSDLSSNTTQFLISDIEALRNHLKIGSWLVTGGSWGTTLALAYAQSFPNRVRGLVLSSITTTSEEEVRWITEDMGNLFPKQWDEFANSVEKFEGNRLIDRYYNAITHQNSLIRESAAKAWCTWEDTHVTLDPQWQPFKDFDNAEFRLQFATLAIHYWKHSGFLSQQPILSNMAALAKIPGTLIHGKYDVSSPFRTAWELHKQWPGSQLILNPSEGHGGPQMSAEMSRAIVEFAHL